MSGSLNKVTLIGNLGKDPEIRSTNDSKEIATFSIATSESWKDKNTDEKKERTEWHRIVVFSEGLVGIIKKYIKKGTKLYIEGSLQTRKWVDNSGIEKYTTEIVLQNFSSKLMILDSKRSGATDGHSPEYSKSNSPSNFDHNDLDDEMPF